MHASDRPGPPRGANTATTLSAMMRLRFGPNSGATAVLLTTDDRFNSGDPTCDESYPTYGQPVLTVANATVIAAVDQSEDHVAGETVDITLENADGNYVVLDPGDGRFAFYAHLKPGSVRVAPGDTVTRGEQIAEAGNTGSSDSPQLHFHVMEGPSVLAAEALP